MITTTRRELLVAASVTSLACLTGLFWATRAQAASVSFKVPLSGAQSVPPVETGGAGTADMTYDSATRALSWTISYTGLSGAATMGHLHGPAAAGANGPVKVWLTKQGSAAENPIKGEATLTEEQAQQFAAGLWYINVHTQAHPGGEIRGQVTPPKS